MIIIIYSKLIRWHAGDDRMLISIRDLRLDLDFKHLWSSLTITISNYLMS